MKYLLTQEEYNDLLGNKEELIKTKRKLNELESIIKNNIKKDISTYVNDPIGTQGNLYINERLIYYLAGNVYQDEFGCWVKINVDDWGELYKK